MSESPKVSATATFATLAAAWTIAMLRKIAVEALT
jgi:hypothetical protein